MFSFIFHFNLTISAQELIPPFPFCHHHKNMIFEEKSKAFHAHGANSLCVILIPREWRWFYSGGDEDVACDGTPSSSKLLFLLKIERRKKTFPFLTQHKSYYSKDFIFFVFIPLLSEDVELHWIINNYLYWLRNFFSTFSCCSRY